MIINLDKFSHYFTVAKRWGREIWLCNNQDYCAKLLLINPGFKCSMHCHKLKTETFIVLQGRVLLNTIDTNGRKEKQVLEEGQHTQLYPYEYHQFSSASVGAPAVLLEISTHHDDADVSRLEESGPISA